MGIPILGDLIDSVKDIVSEVVVDKDKRDQINLEIRKLEDQAEARLDLQIQGQLEINKVEASSGSVFVAGWRPAIGWVGAIALLYAFVLGPLLTWGASVFGIDTKMPEFEFGQLITVILAMLGIGGMRTYEKVKGVSTNDMNDVPGRTQPAGTTTTTETTKETTSVSTPAAPVKPKKKKFKIF